MNDPCIKYIIQGAIAELHGNEHPWDQIWIDLDTKFDQHEAAESAALFRMSAPKKSEVRIVTVPC